MRMNGAFQEEAGGGEVGSAGHAPVGWLCGVCHPESLPPEFDIKALLRDIDRKKAERAEQMPDDAAALAVLFSAWQRLKEMGWREAIYCPKDGSLFDAIEAGSTGIHSCYYEGNWPDGRWWIVDGETWPSRPILFRTREPNRTAATPPEKPSVGEGA